MPFVNIKKEIIDVDSDNDSDNESNADEIVITHDNTDSVVFSIIEQFKQRSDFGLEKYGTNLDRKDLNPIDWVQHAQEEHMDAILYLEKLKQVINDMEFKMKYLENNTRVYFESRIIFILFLFLLFYNLFITQQYNYL